MAFNVSGIRNELHQAYLKLPQVQKLPEKAREDTFDKVMQTFKKYHEALFGESEPRGKAPLLKKRISASAQESRRIIVAARKEKRAVTEGERKEINRLFMDEILPDHPEAKHDFRLLFNFTPSLYIKASRKSIKHGARQFLKTRSFENEWLNGSDIPEEHHRVAALFSGKFFPESLARKESFEQIKRGVNKPDLKSGDLQEICEKTGAYILSLAYQKNQKALEEVLKEVRPAIAEKRVEETHEKLDKAYKEFKENFTTKDTEIRLQHLQQQYRQAQRFSSAVASGQTEEKGAIHSTNDMLTHPDMVEALASRFLKYSERKAEYEHIHASRSRTYIESLYKWWNS